jgi:hypothetical protein
MENQSSGFKDLLNSMMQRRWFITALVLGGFMIRPQVAFITHNTKFNFFKFSF